MTEPRPDARLAQWGALAAGLAHEIKNPLSTMNISLQLLKEDVQERPTIPSGQILPRIDVLISEVRRLQKILNDFLRLARSPDLALRNRDPSELIEDVLAFLAPELRGRKIALMTQLDRTVTELLLDPDLMRQALLNLLKNAIEAMPPDGGTLTVQTLRRKDAFGIEIIDTGQGIAEDIQSRIFDAFFSTKPGGTGIGLALTRQIVELHGGSVRCESAPGHGSKFSIILRLSASPGNLPR